METAGLELWESPSVPVWSMSKALVGAWGTKSPEADAFMATWAMLQLAQW